MNLKPITLSSFALFASLLVLSVNVAAAEPIKADIIDFGVISADHKESAIASKDSHTGSLFEMAAEEAPTFINRSGSFSIELGTQFGIEVQLTGDTDGKIIPVRTRWTHPRFSDGVTVEEWPSPMNIGYGRFAGWVIENNSELVPGKWKVEILFESKVIAEKEFNITIGD